MKGTPNHDPNSSKSIQEDWLMTQIGAFPFGEPIRKVQQKDQRAKRVFVLGVYASAVHAEWVDPSGKQVIRAVAVASEPEIFWCGENAEAIVRRVPIPAAVGRLKPAASHYNGPSGRALDGLFLKPLKIDRDDAWLSDLVPYSCMNRHQRSALREYYDPLVGKNLVPEASWPLVPTRLADDCRRREILDEIVESNAQTIVLLGDQPIRWFLSHFDNRWHSLADFGKARESYGRLHPVELAGKEFNVLPLVHPRQAAGLGRSNPEWRSLHIVRLEMNEKWRDSTHTTFLLSKCWK
jgi:hypothetical protein